MSLTKELKYFGEAINYDLLQLGVSTRLIPSVVSWYDLKCLLFHSPPSSAYCRAKFKELVAWSDTEHLLAVIVDQLNILICKGTKTRSPKKIKRPGVENQTQGRSRYGRGAILAKDFNAWFDGEKDVNN
jgi:hypothetical protein